MDGRPETEADPAAQHVLFTPLPAMMVVQSHGRSRGARHIHSFQEFPMKRMIVLMLLAMFSIGTLSACNTVKGVGKDVQKAGDKVEDAADKTGGTDPA